MNRPPLSISRISREMNRKAGVPGVAKTVAVVGTVTDDIRIADSVIPEGLIVCATRFTAGARARIVARGGEAITFDQLALRHPTGSNVCNDFRVRC